MSLLRPITPADHAAVLAWNDAHVELLAPLDEARLVTLLGWSETGALITHEGRDVGFVLTFGPGTPYDSVNYRWHAARRDSFVYLDRIVIDPSVRRAGIATRVYDELEADAAAHAPYFCLEVNSEPPNVASLAFHRGRGYAQVGEGEFDGHLVALFEKDLRARG